MNNGYIKTERAHIPGVFREDPFRLFFPSGLIVAMWGVFMWPAFYFDWLSFYPGLAHARLMIFGFMTALVCGFLGTAGPRILEASPLSLRELFLLYGAWLVGMIAYSMNALLVGDCALLVAGLIGAFLAGGRIRKRKDLPPPAFVLVLLGLFSAAVALSLHIALQLGGLPGIDGFVVQELARLLGYEAYLLLPVLGIGLFLIPRFGGLAPAQQTPDSRVPNAEWVRQALIAGGFGVFILATYGMQVFVDGVGWEAGVVRFIVVVSWVVLRLPLRFRKEATGTIGRLARASVFFVLLGVLVSSWWNGSHAIAARHLLLLGGYGLLGLCVVSWVVLAHSGCKETAKRPNWAIRLAGFWVLVALGTRLVGGYMESIRESHYIYAAFAWCLGIICLLWILWPRFWVVEKED